MGADRGLLGQSIGRYRIVEELGRGGMAVVYRGLDTELGRDVAIKVMHAYLESTPEAGQRFRREARAVAALRHPNIVEIYDYAPAEEGRPALIVTELVQGSSLRGFIDGHGTPLPEVAAMIGAKLARALSCAHERGIIHRDIKPENLLIDVHGRLVLTDFGIARIAGVETMTETGAMVGSPAYMSPEQARGHDLDARSDVFSCGTLLYLLCTATLPFAAKDPVSTALNIIKGDYVRPGARNPRLAAALERVICQCLRRERAERYANALTLAEALEAVCAEDGLVDLDAELQRYFADPPAYNEALTAQVLERSLARAREALRSGKAARALGECNRILAVAPDHREGLRIALRLGQRRRARLVLAVGAGALLVAAVAVAGWGLLARRPVAGDGTPAGAGGRADDLPIAGRGPDAGAALSAGSQRPDAAAARSPAAGVATVAAKTGRPGRAAVAPAPAHSAAASAAPVLVAARDAGVPPSPEAPAPVKVSVFFTQWCELSVDGRPVGRVPPRRDLALLPGPHRIVCTQEPVTPLRFDKVVDVEAGRDIAIHRPLSPSARFTVALREGDELRIDGQVLRNGAHEIRPASHKVVVLRRGEAIGEGVVDLSAARPCTIVDVPRVQCVSTP